MKKGILEESLNGFEQSLLRLDRAQAEHVIQTLLTDCPPLDIIEQLVAHALERIGAAWERGDVSLSQVYMSGRICESIVDALLPPGHAQRKNQPKMAVTVFEDYHSLGKRIVYATVRSAGFDLADYGRTDASSLPERLNQDGIDILLVSVLMLPSALRLREVITRIVAERPGVRVIVGGAPFLFDGDLWRRIGAFAMGRAASDAVPLIDSWMEERP